LDADGACANTPCSASAQHFAPSTLDPVYDGDPGGTMGFVRLKIG
jgi:hypothetical protein